MFEPIRFAGVVTTNDMMRAYKLAWRGNWHLHFRNLFFVTVSLAIFGLLFLGWRAFQSEDRSDAWIHWGFGLGLLLVLISSALKLRRRMSRALKGGLFSNDEGYAEINVEGVNLTDGQTSLHVAWEKFAGFRSTEDMAIYFIDYPRSFLVFMRRLVATPTDWDRFLSVSKERLKTL